MTQTPGIAEVPSTKPRWLLAVTWFVYVIGVLAALDYLFDFIVWNSSSTFERDLVHGFVFGTAYLSANLLIGFPFPTSRRAKLGPYRPPGWAQRQEVLALIVKHATDAVASEMSQRSPSIFQHFFYGAIGINSRNLATWYLFRTDAELTEARSSGRIDSITDLTRSKLANYAYPTEAIPKVSISFTTDEDIQRKTGGNYRYYFQ